MSGSSARHRLWSKCLAGAAVGTALALAGELASADEIGESFWTPGSFASLAATPSQPGFSLTSTYYHTSTTAGSDVVRALDPDWTPDRRGWRKRERHLDPA